MSITICRIRTTNEARTFLIFRRRRWKRWSRQQRGFKRENLMFLRLKLQPCSQQFLLQLKRDEGE